MKYSDEFCDWLVDEGYTHCFFVAGGNIMHILDSARTRFRCIPFVHEVSAGIAAEYFNEQSARGSGRAFALVTAGPGLTNTVTAFAGAFLESRELLIIGGQAKSTDLASGGIRQLGHQEIDGLSIIQSVCKKTLQIRFPVTRETVISTIRSGSEPRKGPIFIEFCLDAQGAPVVKHGNHDPMELDLFDSELKLEIDMDEIRQASQLVAQALRPVLLIGGGVDRNSATSLVEIAEQLGMPVATTWNGADRIASDHYLYFGRPSNWGMRWSNVLIQQADLIIAAGTRLSLWETGFNWQEFAPMAKIIQVDISKPELEKKQPVITLGICADATETVEAIGRQLISIAQPESWRENWQEWRAFGCEVRELLPLRDPENVTSSGYVDPYGFITDLGAVTNETDVIIPCSSGGAFTVAMQTLELKSGQKITTDKALASMGYGLAGAIGAALANRDARTFLIEGDGGFAQNMQEIGTAVANELNLKIFIFDNQGYGSIRSNQRNYFGGAYIGCDSETGLQLPNWVKLFDAFGVPAINLNSNDVFTEDVVRLLNLPGPAAFIVPIDAEQTYFPKISSSVSEDGTIKSNPLHLMDPPLSEEISRIAFRYLEAGKSNE
jgi:acetolactate synthase-1/2/3 large subunit